MMKQMVMVASLVTLVGAVEAANLVDNGDFSRCENRRLPPECRAEDGVRTSLFTEDLTWNRCLKAEIARSYTNKAGVVSVSGSAFMGAAGKLGFPVEPGKSYDVSVDLRGSCASVRVSLTFWKGECRNWEDRVSVPVGQGFAAAGKDWKTVRGSVKAPEGAKVAAIQLSFWGSSEKGCGKVKLGDWALADNFRCELSRKNLVSSSGAAAVEVPPRKVLATADGAGVADFYNLRKLQPSDVRTTLRASTDAEGIVLDFEAEEPLELVPGKADKVWSGDSFEFFFVNVDGRLRHFAFSLAGAQYANLGDGKNIRGDGWTVSAQKVDGGWRATARVPFALAGFSGVPEPGVQVKFNVGRNRVKGREFINWVRSDAGYANVAAFGTLVVGDWTSAIRREFGEERTIDSRDAYVRACAEIEAERFKAKLAKFRDMKFSTAVISPISDFSCPFLPEEIFEPATNIRIRAAVNEVKAMPLALANLTDRAEDFLVLLETEVNEYNGDFGLGGFPAGQVKVRRAMRMRDASGDTPTLRFDPLMSANDGACALTVPPHEAGVVWFDFDTKDVRPGTYVGRLRVIPTCEEGRFVRRKGGGWADRDYAGKMQTIPVALVVEPIVLPKRSPIPSGFYMNVPNQEAYDLAADLGAERHLINIWSFPLKGEAPQVAERISNDRAWAAKHGIRPRFDIAYSAYRTFLERCNGKKDPAKTEALWPEYVRNVKRIMNANGVPDEDFFIETLDEPRENDLEDLIRAHKLAKAAVPTVRLCVTIAAWELSERRMNELADVTDEFIFWGRGYFTESWKVKMVEKFRARGGVVRHYMCDTSMRMPLDTYFRHHAWIGERYGLDGNHLYEFSKFVKSFGSTDFKELTYGDIVYYAFGKPVPSVRYMAFREGITDIKYLAAVRAVAGDDPEAKAFLERAAKEVIDLTPRDPKTPDRMREEARRLLLRFTKE